MDVVIILLLILVWCCAVVLAEEEFHLDRRLGFVLMIVGALLIGVYL